MALASCNCERAATSLAEQDLPPVPARTLRKWRQEHADLYARVERDVLPQIRADLAADYTDLARYQLEVARKVLDRLNAEADDPDKLPTRDLAGALRNVKVSAAVGTDKSQLLRGEPTERKEYRSGAAAELERRLRALGVVIEGEPPIVDAEVVDDRQLPEGKQADQAGAAD